MMSRVGCLICPGGCKRNGGNGVQGGYMGLSWGIFTTEKVMSRLGCLICPGGCVRRMVEMVSRVDIWVCLGGSSLQKK